MSYLWMISRKEGERLGISWHLEKRYKSSWTIVIDLGRDPATGKQKRVYRSVRCSKKQAEQEAVRLVAEIQSGMYSASEKTILKDYLARWLKDVCVPRLEAKTVESYRTCIDLHIAPRIGQLWLADLQPRHIQGLYADMATDGIGARTIELTHVTLHSALKQAVRWQLLSRNPAEGAVPPRPERREMKALDPERVAAIMNVARKTPIGILVYLALCTGMRKAELLGLKWTDIDWDNQTIQVQRNLVRVGGKTIVKDTKTRGSRRSIPVDKTVIDHLRALKAKSKSEYVFTRTDSINPMDPHTVTHQFSRIAALAGVPGLRFHDLRHTHATMLLSLGAHPKVIQERLGHSTIAVTMDIYSHVAPTMQREAADIFGSALFEIERRFSGGRPTDSGPVQ